MKLNFGCGNDIKEDFVNVDLQEGKGIDKSFNFEEFPYPFGNNTFSVIESIYVFEHITGDNRRKVFDELCRICKDQAIIKIKVPHWNCAGVHDDSTHKFPAFTRTQLEEVAGVYLKNQTNRDYKVKTLSCEIKFYTHLWFIPNFIKRVMCNYIPNIAGAYEITFKVIKK